MLYSAARETVATLTGRGPYKTYILPSVSFADFQTEKKKKSPPRPRTKKG